MISRIITLIISVFILSVIYIWSGEKLLLLIIGVVFFLIIVGITCLLLAKSKVKVDLSTRNSTLDGQGIKIVVDIANQSKIPFFLGMIKLSVNNVNFTLKTKTKKFFSICGRNAKTIILDVNCVFCGKYELTIDRIRLFDFWGIFSCTKIKNKCFVSYMFPRYYTVNSISQVMKANYEKEKYFSNVKGNILSEILQYREYKPGDNLKLVNWKLSKKMDELIVREFDTPTDNQVLLVFDSFEGNKIYKNIVYMVFTSISITYLQNKISHYVSWYNSINKKLENYYIEKFDDLFRIIRLIFETEKKDFTMGYLIDNLMFEKYAKVIYVTNEITEGIRKELIVKEQVKIIMINEENFDVTKIKESICSINI